MVNLHNTIAEYLAANPPTEADIARLQRFNERLVAETQFDPSRPMQLTPPNAARVGGSVPWWRTYGVPYVRYLGCYDRLSSLSAAKDPAARSRPVILLDASLRSP